MQTKNSARTLDFFRRITKYEEDAITLRRLFKDKIENEVRDQVSSNVDILVAKGDLPILRRDLLAFEMDLKSKFREMIAWMFVIWVGSLLSTFYLLQYFLEKA